MNNKNIYHHTIEEIFLDDQLTSYLKTISNQELEQLIAHNPTKGDVLRQAYLLLNHLRLQEQQQNETVVELGLQSLKENAIGVKRRLMLYRVASVAAVLLILVMSYKAFTTIPNLHDASTQTILTELQNYSIDTNKISLTSDKSNVYFGNNDTINQTIAALQHGTEVNTEVNQQKLFVPHGQRIHVQFSDGTFAWVNSGSKLIYPEKFVGNSREIYLEGEVFLDVAKDKSAPFIIHTSQMDIRVLGTSLNISTYKENSKNSVVLITGSVEVKSQRNKEILSPNQGFFLFEDGQSNIVDVDVYEYICWKDGIIQLKDKTLGDIVNELSRYYNVEIEMNEKYINDQYKGKLDLKDSIDDILSTLAVSSKFTFKHIDNKIVIQ